MNTPGARQPHAVHQQEQADPGQSRTAETVGRAVLGTEAAVDNDDGGGDNCDEEEEEEEETAEKVISTLRHLRQNFVNHCHNLQLITIAKARNRDTSRIFSAAVETDKIRLPRAWCRSRRWSSPERTSPSSTGTDTPSAAPVSGRSSKSRTWPTG